MTMKSLVSAAAIAAAIAVPGAALAATTAVTTTDLNLRAGPGPNHEILTTMPGNMQIQLMGCVEAGTWCQVDYNGQVGWASANYLAAEMQGERVVVTERIEAVPTVQFDRGAATGALGGAVVGALVGGPVGAAVGGAAGAAVGGTIDPPPRVTTYVTERQVEPVYLEGEVVVGAGVPETVDLYEIPEYDYRFTYVNGQRVLVDPQTRRIVHVWR